MKTVKVGNAQAFWGDQPDAPLHLLQQQPDLDYLTLDYLAEVSLSIMAIQRDRDPTQGYAKDFIDVVRSLIPLWKAGHKTKIICNAGGLNPHACAEACREVLKELPGMKIGVVGGDNVLDLLKATPSHSLFQNLETKKELQSILKELVTANAYLGAKPITQALEQGANIVITGRVADPSLTVAACAHYFGWDWNDFNRLAGATVAGHLIECGTQVTGGIANRWLELHDLARIGYPVAEIDEDGNSVITKPAKTGGAVTLEIVKEQLVYEIGDPGRYLSPDATVSFLTLHLEQLGANRVRVAGATGTAPPPTYKVSASYRDGYRSEAMLTIVGKDAPQKGRACGEVVLERVRLAGYDLARTQIECLGAGDSVPDILPEHTNLLEVVLRIAVADPRHEAVEAFTKEIAPLVTSGPAGVTGYATGRPHIRPVFGYWPCLIDTTQVKPTIEILEVA